MHYEGWPTEEGQQPFQDISRGGSSLQLERRITTLGEPRPSSIDVSVRGSHNVAIECKLAECDADHCSRPQLDKTDPGHCDGPYKFQHRREERCALTTLGIKYWRFLASSSGERTTITTVALCVRHTNSCATFWPHSAQTVKLWLAMQSYCSMSVTPRFTSMDMEAEHSQPLKLPCWSSNASNPYRGRRSCRHCAKSRACNG